MRFPHFYQCQRKGTSVVEGKLYCNQHDPYLDKKRAAARQAQWDADHKRRQDKWTRERLESKACAGLSNEQLVKLEGVLTARPELVARINNYLENGGYFNPEMMEHDKVRILLLDIRNTLLL